MDSTINNMERWRGNTLYRASEKGARVIVRKRTRHIPKSITATAVKRGATNYE